MIHLYLSGKKVFTGFVSLLALTALLVLPGCAQSVSQDILGEDLFDQASTAVIGSQFVSFGIPDDPRLTTNVVDVTGQSFTKAWRFTTTGPFENQFVVQIGANNITPIAKDDVLLVRFWARAVGTSQTAQTEFALEEGPPDYTKSVLIGVSFDRAWKQYQVPFLAHRDFGVGEASILFRLAYANQSFELGGVRVANFKKERTVGSIASRGFDYPGIEPDAAWRTSANSRIDQYRKGNLAVKVLDAAGNPVTGASVKIEMQQHAFPFGSAVAADPFLNNQTYQDNVFKLFNRVVLESDFKWVDWESYSRNNALEALRILRSRGVTVRGHNLIWPLELDYILPIDVINMVRNGDTAGVRSRIEGRLVDTLGATKGQIVEWDVINEPSANKFLQNLLGEDEMAAWLRRAKELDPNAKMFINDYGNLGEGTLDVEYKRILRRMQALGAPLEGIGLQGHFSWDLTPPEELNSRLNSFGRFGVPLSITEFDVNISDERLQAAYLRDALTVAFANPNVNSFLMWGFWEGQHWLPQAALYRLDWSIKPNGQVWNDLIFKQWWTNVTGRSNTSGDYSTRGFLGRYKITVSKNGQTLSRFVNLARSGTTVTMTLR
jgi:GH35 family endo-1,4-beta-xylanase